MALPIACASIAKITLIWLDHYLIFLKMMWSDADRHFSVVCGASKFAIGCALLQIDIGERERVIAFESRRLKASKKSYPVHD